MRRLVIVTALVLAAAVFYRSLGSAETGTGALTLPEPAPNIGAAAPTFTVPGEGNAPFDLDDRGIYILAFWSALNRQSNQYRPEFERLAREYSNDDITFASVYVNSPPDIESINYTVMQDRTGRLTSLYNVKRVPRLFMIEDGRIRLVQNGYYEDYDDRLEGEIRRYLEERDLRREAREENLSPQG